MSLAAGGSRLTPSTRREHPMAGGRDSAADADGAFYGEQIPVDNERSSVSHSQSQMQQRMATVSEVARPAALSTVSSTSSSYSRSSSISAAAGATPSESAAAPASVAPAAASSRGALALPAHPTTPAPASTDSALEAAAGINAQKLSPSDFTFGRCLGEGSFAKVVLATRRGPVGASGPGDRYACKMVDKQFVQRMGKIQTVINEKKILTLLHGHVGIVKLAYTFQDASSLYYVMELAGGGEMFADLKRLGKYDARLVRFYAAELVEVLAFMHARSVVHRDLKPENILFSDRMHLKLTDFGTARILEPAAADGGGGAGGAKSRRGSFVGTAEYVSPEILRDQPPTTSADLWSLGAILYQLSTGRVPFRGATEYLTFQKILALDLQWREGEAEAVDPDLRDLIEKLLVLDPAARLGAGPTVEEGYAALRAHPFFRGVDFASIFEQDVPPRPQPTTIVQDSFEINNGDAEDDADTVDAEDEEEEDNEGADSDEDAFAASAAASAAAASAAAASASAADSVSAEAGDSVSPLPHGPTVAEKTGGAGVVAGSDNQSAHSVWSQFLFDDERIVFAGTVIKRRALFARKRQLILTSRPRLFYVDPSPEVMQLKKGIHWTAQLWAEVINANTFYIHTPDRDYYMKALSTSAYCWCNEINNLQLALKAKSGDSPESAAATATGSAAAASTPSSASSSSASSASTASANSRFK